MKPTEQNTKTPPTATGLFALLGAFSRVKGSGMPRAGYRLILPALATTLGALVFMSTPALAAAPEKPEVSVEDTTAVVATPSTEVVLHGVLNPAATAPSEAGTYRFLYKKSKTECTGESKAPASPGIALGIEHEEVSETLTGLAPDTEYTVCLSDRDGEGETLSSPVTFKTASPPEKPVTISPAKEITATTAKLEGTLNPVKAGEAGTYEFTYQRSATECNREFGAPEPAGTMTGAKGQAVSATVTKLEPNKEYSFCVVAINKAGEPIAGNLVTFKTSAAKPSVVNESAEPKAEEVRLNATVNASNEATECHFQYGETSVTEHEVLCEQGTPPGTLEGGEQGVAVTVPGLKQNTTYHYRVVVKNATGEVKGTGIAAEEEFTTAIHPETPTGLKAEAITPMTATLHGVLNSSKAGNAGSYEFIYRPSGEHPSQCQGAGETVVGEPATGAKEEVAKAELSGLNPNTQYTFCLRAHNEVGEEATTAPVAFTTLVAPLEIKSEFSTVVDSSEARLEAEIYDGNSEAAYHFEYGPAAGDYTVSIPAPDGHIHASLEGRSVSAAAVGLEPATTYHYRVVAANALPGEVDGPDQEFTTPATQPTGTTPGSCSNEQRRSEQPYGLGLPDCRAYEIVSPLETNGNDATDPFVDSGHVRAAAEGAAVTYSSRGSFAEPHGAIFENQLLSRREPEHDRWGTRSITPLLEGEGILEEPSGYDGMFFTPELTEGLASTAAALTSAPEATPAGLQEIYLANLMGGQQSYRLISQLPQSEELYERPYAEGSVFPLGASSDLSHVVFITAPTPGTVGPLREWVNGRVVLVGVSNGGESWTGATVGSSSPTNPERPDAWRAVSEDGSRVIFNYGGELYVRVNAGVKVEPEPEREQSEMNGEECLEPAKACTVKLSAGTAKYWGANMNDTKIFYTENGNLYEYELPIGSVKGKATALTHSGEVQGVVQVSEDGSYVYFVAKDDLYVSHEGDVAFVATLSAGDESDWLEGPGADSAILAPDAASGTQMAFTSEASLTGYDNRDAVSGQPDEEVYLYDAETGTLACASCNPSGARPLGPASLAHGSYTGNGSSDYRPRDLLKDGALFFDSKDALIPRANNGRQNVYEYENGHVYAISNVAGGNESFFLDASASGDDVFFGSADKLLPEDTGDNVVVWDAREDGGFPVAVSPPACTTAEACRAASPPTPGAYGAPPSATFSGPGNIAPPPPAVVKKATTKKPVKCKRGFVKKKVKKRETCVKKKSKKKAKRATNDRRGK